MGDKTLGYNGWANWETWIVHCWLDNDRRLYEHYREVAHTEISKNKKSATFKLSLALNLEFDSWMPELSAGPYLDLLNGAMREVNWHQIAKHLIEQALEEEENYTKQVN